MAGTRVSTWGAALLASESSQPCDPFDEITTLYVLLYNSILEKAQGGRKGPKAGDPKGGVSVRNSPTIAVRVG